jgi:hypothetical protein
MSMLASELKDGHAVYDCICEGCGSEGTLAVPLDHHGTIGCPEDCGAMYIQWKNLDGAYELTCVVCPVFEDVEEGIKARATGKAN